jgi:hypothetical protein
VRLQLFHRDELDRGRVRRLEIHGRRDTASQRFQVTRRAKTPFIARLEAGEIPLGVRRYEIVSLKDRIVKKLARYLHANRVQTCVLRASATISVPIKSGHGIATTTAELGSKNVRRHGEMIANPRSGGLQPPIDNDGGFKPPLFVVSVQLSMDVTLGRQVLAYWLTPAEPARSFFTSTIAELAARFDAPLFEPHMTIYATRKGKDIPGEVLSRALADCDPFRLSVRDIRYSPEFTRTLFVRFEPSLPLSGLSRALKQASALHDSYQLNPHLSLIYKKMTRTAKTDVVAAVSLPFAEVFFDSAKAVICPARIESRQDVEAWRIAAVQRLTA